MSKQSTASSTQTSTARTLRRLAFKVGRKSVLYALAGVGAITVSAVAAPMAAEALLERQPKR